MGRPKLYPNDPPRKNCVTASVGVELAQDFKALCENEHVSRSKALANFVRMAVMQKTLTTIVTVQEGEKFNSITRALKLPHSEAIRQLIRRVNNGSITLRKEAKPLLLQKR
jgi:hypothetical protein